MTDDMLYSRCATCGGTGKGEWQHAGPVRRLVCPPCGGDGWIPTGVTMGQLERMADAERALAGDPGLPAERRRAILAKLRGKVLVALGREGMLDGDD